MKNVSLMGILKVVEDDGTVNFIAEGDYVTCYIDNNVHYIGKLRTIGYWQTNNTESMPVAIAIEGKAPKTVSSTNVVLLSDIKWIHKMTEEERKEIEELISKISQHNKTNRDENKETPLPEPPEPTMLWETFSSVEEVPTNLK